MAANGSAICGVVRAGIIAGTASMPSVRLTGGPSRVATSVPPPYGSHRVCRFRSLGPGAAASLLLGYHREGAPVRFLCTYKKIGIASHRHWQARNPATCLPVASGPDPGGRRIHGTRYHHDGRRVGKHDVRGRGHPDRDCTGLKPRARRFRNRNLHRQRTRPADLHRNR